VGMSLIGEVLDHVLMFAYGLGFNGKTTFFEALIDVFGTYAEVIRPEVLMATKREEHPTELADLFGLRFVVSAETKEGTRLNENQVKNLTGGDSIKARRMREDFWTFKPSHTLWLYSNYKPEIRGTDVGIQRRPQLVGFGVTIPPEKRVLGFGKQLVKAEGPGILNWAVEGLQAYLEDGGLRPPESVTTATKEYLSENDVLGDFIEESCLGERRDGVWVSTAPKRANTSVNDIYRVFKWWAKDHGEWEMPQKVITTRLRDRGYKIVKSHGVNRVFGLALEKDSMKTLMGLTAERDAVREVEDMVRETGGVIIEDASKGTN